jgi:hypothetical protein
MDDPLESGRQARTTLVNTSTITVLKQAQSTAENCPPRALLE